MCSPNFLLMSYSLSFRSCPSILSGALELKNLTPLFTAVASCDVISAELKLHSQQNLMKRRHVFKDQPLSAALPQDCTVDTTKAIKVMSLGIEA